jgi:DNA-binding IclR family transcriptional regulator
VKLPAIRHRLLLSLATAQRPVKLRPLASQLDRGQSGIHAHLLRLREAGLVEFTPAGYRLRPHIVVSERGFVGRMVPLESAGG